MSIFSDRSTLPSALGRLTPLAGVAWELVRELHRQARISAVEGEALLDGLKGAAAPSTSLRNDAPAVDGDIDEAIAKAVRIAGSQGRLAELAGISQQHVSRLLTRQQIISAEVAVKLEAATSGQVSRGRLRSDLWPDPPSASARKNGPEPLHTVADLFDRFEGSAKVGRAVGKSTEHADAMRRRNSIPLRYWPALIAAARDVGLDLDEATLLRLHLVTPARETAP